MPIVSLVAFAFSALCFTFYGVRRSRRLRQMRVHEDRIDALLEFILRNEDRSV